MSILESGEDVSKLGISPKPVRLRNRESSNQKSAALTSRSLVINQLSSVSLLFNRERGRERAKSGLTARLCSVTHRQSKLTTNHTPSRQYTRDSDPGCCSTHTLIRAPKQYRDKMSSKFFLSFFEKYQTRRRRRKSTASAGQRTCFTTATGKSARH